MKTYPIERTTRAATALLAALSLSACAPLFRQPPPAGAALAEVTAALGQPAAIYPDRDGGRVLEYRGQPMGQFQHMARIGPDGRLVSYDQVLTSENFAKVKIGQWTKDDILRNFGQPAETSTVGFHDYEVWTYRYKESGVWNSLMHVHFDQQGVVRQMLNGPDPRYDDRFPRF